VWEEITALGALDWLTTVLALVYVLLAARNNPWCWVFGAVACAIWAYLSIVKYQLYSDGALQVFYVGMSIIGLYNWRFGGQAQRELPITRMTSRDHLLFIALAGLAGWLLGYFVGENFQAAATYWDALTTTFSVGATFYLLRRKLENWLYWIVIDVAYVGIYYGRGAWLFAAIMLVYIGVAIYGYLNWRKESQGVIN